MMYIERINEWFQQATPEDKKLRDKVYDFEELFSDMLFKDDSITGKMIACKSQMKNNDECNDSEDLLPEKLRFFTYTWFWIKVLPLDNGVCGCFNRKDLSLTVIPGRLNDDSVVLHEMIHLHEYIINELPMFYHDVLLWCLYKDMSSKIPDLDMRIEGHGHILNENDIYKIGGLHDILFLLKSFDLDLKMGYKLGTVFGYGMTD